VYNMYMYTTIKSSARRGFALLDSIVAIALFAILFTGFLALMQVGIKTITEHKARAGALATARSHIEYIHSLDYSAVGVQEGNPSGNLQGVTVETLNNIPYTITTVISWRDDAGDGLGVGDSNPNDYKDIWVSVSWPEHAGQSGSVALSTIISDYEVE